MDTIFAQSSRVGKAGVAIFRISGPGSLFALNQLLGSPEKLSPRVMYCRKIYIPGTSELLDQAMVVRFPVGASFTGEDVVEIHTHGSHAITNLLTKALLNMEGIRLAEPGEFARRAFLNGKFDLTAAEGLADLIEAETQQQHRQAIRQMSGELERLYESWRANLLNIISLCEAYIDFPEEDIPEEVLGEVEEQISLLKSSFLGHLNDNRRGERLRQGIRLTILGRPNVGKSSLLNFLLQREVAIVSTIAGTTRDIVEGHLDIGGYPIILQDTAGIRGGSSDIIEQEGIKRAIASASAADMRIVLLDASNPEEVVFPEEIGEFLDPATTIIVVNKIDLNSEFKGVNCHREEDVRPTRRSSHSSFQPLSGLPRLALPARNDAYIQVRDDNCGHYEPICISLKDKLGLDLLLQEIERIAGQVAGPGESPLITRQRHRRGLEEAITHLERANIHADLVLAAEDIRLAVRALGSITGKISVDEILGEVFSKFCIGK